jgi:hypothetical protein
MRTSFCLLVCWALGSCGDVLPQREQPVGTCTKEADCGAEGQVCKANQCVPCGAHSDCASAVCDLYGDLGGSGRCVPASNIIYVDSTDPEGQSCPLATGSSELPWCSMDAALGQLMREPGKIISLHGSPTSYLVPVIGAELGPLVIVGPARFTAGAAAVLGASTGDSLLQVGSGASAVLDGVLITAPGITASPGAKVTIRQSTLDNLQHGALFDNSTVTLDRDLIVHSTLGLAFDASTVSITNTIIAGNSAAPSTNLIEMNGGSGIFQFNTVAHNVLGSSSALVLNCTGGTGFLVKNSIFAQNGAAEQLAKGCQAVANSLILGKLDPAAAQIKQEPVFESPEQLDLRLKPSDPTNAQYLFDRANQVNPAAEKNIDHDYYGTPRPQGSGYDIGAFERPAS